MDENNITDIHKYKKNKKIKKIDNAKLIIVILIFCMFSFGLYHYRNYLTIENARVVMSYLSIDGLKKIGEPPANISFIGGSENIYGVYNNKFTILSADGLKVYSKLDAQEQFFQFSYKTPMMQITPKFILTYDMLGTKLNIIGDSSIVKSEEYDYPILYAKMNDSGYFAVGNIERGYKGVVTVYNRNMQQIYKWYSADKRIIGIDLSPNSHDMCLSTISSSGETMDGEVKIFAFDKTEPVATKTFTDELILALAYKDSNHITAISAKSLHMFDSDGKDKGEYSFEGRQLQTFSTDPKRYNVLVISDNNVGLNTTVEIIDLNGKKISSYNMAEDVKSISANDQKIAILSQTKLTTLDSKGRQIGQIDVNPDARKVILTDNGNAYIVGSGFAQYIGL